MKRYVVGFMFTNDFVHVALLRKERPIWQKGLYNGIGGKVDQLNKYGNLESTYEAMVREFQEETGYIQKDWKPLCETMWGDLVETKHGTDINFDSIDAGKVSYFTCATDYVILGSPTDEKVVWHPTSEINDLPLVPSCTWAIPMAIQYHRIPFHSCEVIYETDPALKDKRVDVDHRILESSKHKQIHE